VLQRVYLAVLEGKAAYRGGASAKTWLFAIIRRTAADERRRQWLRALRLVRYFRRAGGAAAQEPPGEGLERQERRALFLGALAAVPARQRQALQLVFYHDLTLTEAAEAMGVSVGSARTHYERGKKALRRKLKGTVLDETGIGTRRVQGAVLRPEARG
jgi:RNA polymerase sigma-70 factor (ECF subfamily)